MSIVLPVAPTSDLQTYDGLVAALERWLDGSEAAVSYPHEMIALAEAYIRRLVLHHDREGTSTLTATSANVALPSDFMQIRSANVVDDPNQPLDQVTPDVLRRHWTPSHTGRPLEYALQASAMILGPAPDKEYSIEIVYQRALTPLSSVVQTNWLIENHFDLYLYASMMHGEVYPGNDQRAATLKGAVDQMIADVNAEGNRKRFGGAIRMRSGVQEVR